jgi:AraC-like DNA-binding protein
MRSIDLSGISDASVQACEEIAKEAGVNLKDCYQCGKCTAGCPLADSMDLMPREVIRYLQLGAIDVVLDAKTQLCTTERTVKQIAYDLNFPSQSFFGKYFSRIVGLSPAAYRRRHKR